MAQTTFNIARIRRNFRGPMAALGLVFFFLPAILALLCCTVLGVSLDAVGIIGGICLLVGAFYFRSREDEYLLPLLAGVEVLLTVGILWFLR